MAAGAARLAQPAALHWLDAEPTTIPGLPGTWRARDADTVEVGGVTPADDVRLPGSDAPVDGSATMRPVDGLPGVMVSVGEQGRRDRPAHRRLRAAGARPAGPHPHRVLRRPGLAGRRALGRHRAVHPVRRAARRSRWTPSSTGLHHYPTAVGTVAFELGGETQTLVALPGKDGGLSLHFRDGTSGQESYGGGRILRTGDPEPDGTLVVDLNRTVNLPCAFIAHATCPLPPAGNTVTVPVQAGERSPLRPDLR